MLLYVYLTTSRPSTGIHIDLSAAVQPRTKGLAARRSPLRTEHMRTTTLLLSAATSPFTVDSAVSVGRRPYEDAASEPKEEPRVDEPKLQPAVESGIDPRAKPKVESLVQPSFERSRGLASPLPQRSPPGRRDQQPLNMRDRRDRPKAKGQAGTRAAMLWTAYPSGRPVRSKTSTSVSSWSTQPTVARTACTSTSGCQLEIARPMRSPARAKGRPYSSFSTGHPSRTAGTASRCVFQRQSCRWL